MITLDPETSRRVFEISRSVWFWYNSIKDMSGFSIRDEGGGWVAPDALPDDSEAEPVTDAPLAPSVIQL